MAAKVPSALKALGEWDCMAQEIRQRVAKQIEEAFADTPYPGDENIGWGCGSKVWI